MFDLISPAFLLLGVPAILISGISKSGFGGAFGGLAVAGLALVISPLEAAAVTLPIKAFVAGTVSGFTSFIAHAGGPPVLAYLLPRQLPRERFVATTVVFIGVLNLVKLLPYAALGQFNARTLGGALVLAPFAPLGIWLGQRVQGRLSPGTYTRACQALLALSGAKLLFDGLIRT